MIRGSCLCGNIEYELAEQGLCLEPIVNIYTGSKASWYTITDNLPVCKESFAKDFIKKYFSPAND